MLIYRVITVQSEEEQQGRHGSDATSRTGAIVDELLHGVVSDNLSTADILNPAVSQPPSHEASQGKDSQNKQQYHSAQ